MILDEPTLFRIAAVTLTAVVLLLVAFLPNRRSGLSLAELHRGLGVDLVPAFTNSGAISRNVFFASKLRVRLISRWRAAWSLLVGRDQNEDGGVLLVDYGKAKDGGPVSPMVCLDWATYAILLQAHTDAVQRRLDELEADSRAHVPHDDEDAAKLETGGTF